MESSRWPTRAHHHHRSGCAHLQEAHWDAPVGVKLRVTDTAPGTGELDVATGEHLTVAHRVLVLKGARQQVGEDLVVAAGTSARAGGQMRESRQTRASPIGCDAASLNSQCSPVGVRREPLAARHPVLVDDAQGAELLELQAEGAGRQERADVGFQKCPQAVQRHTAPRHAPMGRSSSRS